MLRRFLAFLILMVATFPAAAQQPAKDLFGAVESPWAAPVQPIGSYAKGCLAGGAALAIDRPAWQAMRLSRNRHWGHPELLEFDGCGGELAYWLSDEAWKPKDPPEPPAPPMTLADLPSACSGVLNGG